MVIKGKYPVRRHHQAGKIIEQITNFSFLDCDASYIQNNNIRNKINGCPLTVWSC